MPPLFCRLTQPVFLFILVLGFILMLRGILMLGGTGILPVVFLGQKTDA